MSEYEKQAMEFAEKYGVKLQVLGSEYKAMSCFDDETKRNVFKCRLSRGRKSYTFEFGQSISSGSKEPTMYEVLACLAKWEVRTFEEFCREFGYDSLPLWKYPVVKKIYLGIRREYQAVCRLFPEEEAMEELYEIA